MHITGAHICRATEELLSSMLDLQVQGIRDSQTAGGQPYQAAACVHISGDWEGTVLLELPAPLVTLLASRLLGSELDDLTDEDTRDAVGEIINIIGGNLKSTFEGHCTLSLPAVVAGERVSMAVPGTHLLEAVAFDYQGDRFVVSVLEAQARRQQHAVVGRHVEHKGGHR